MDVLFPVFSFWIFICLYTAINSDDKCFFKSTYNQNSLQYTFLVNSSAGAKPKKFFFVFVVFFSNLKQFSIVNFSVIQQPNSC